MSNTTLSETNSLVLYPLKWKEALYRIVFILRTDGPQSNPQLQGALDLSTWTVTAMMQLLLDDGIVSVQTRAKGIAVVRPHSRFTLTDKAFVPRFETTDMRRGAPVAQSTTLPLIQDPLMLALYGSRLPRRGPSA